MKQLTETQMTMLGTAHLNPNEKPNNKVKCWVAPVVIDDKGNATTLTELANYGMDIYDLLDLSGRRWATEYDRIAFYTVGWASPVGDDNDDTPPSQHPERKRVALLCVATRIGEFSTAMFMWDNPNQTEMMIQTEGQGALKEMAMSLFE